MSSITVTQEGGAMRAQVVASRRVSPSVQRVTLAGDDLARLRWRGFDQWVRLFLPSADPTSLDHVPDTLSTRTYLRMQALPARRRPTVRSYTLRAWRPERLEVDIDLVAHGDHGVAGPWAVAARPGDPVALLDQGCGWPSPPADHVVLVADETGLPAVAGILRDLPAGTRAVALVEVPDEADAQDVGGAGAYDLRWLVRAPDQAPGTLALAELTRLDLPDASRHAFAVGESSLATGARRHLVRERGWGKGEVTFCGYWKR